MNTATALALASAALAAFNQAMLTLQQAKQDSEMTPEEEAEFDKLVEERMKQPHWQKSGRS